jgi:death on curing protein
MRYLALGEVAELHRRLIQVTGGASGILDFAALESAIAQPRAALGASICIRRWSRQRRR